MYMLGERKVHHRKCKNQVHPGQYDLCELFSQPRVVLETEKAGLRGGWCLDINHEDPVTEGTWDLSRPEVHLRGLSQCGVGFC